MKKLLYAATFVFAFISEGRADFTSESPVCPSGLNPIVSVNPVGCHFIRCCPGHPTLNSDLVCVGACLSDANCTGGEICDPTTSQCVFPCQSNSNCENGQVCNPLTHLCVNPCRSNNDCSKNQICSSQLCVNVGPNPVSPSSCNSNKDCIRGQICSASHTCVASKETSK